MPVASPSKQKGRAADEYETRYPTIKDAEYSQRLHVERRCIRTSHRSQNGRLGKRIEFV